MALATVNLEEVKPLVMDCFRARLTPALISSPGIGKSDLAKQIAKEQNLLLIDIRLSMYDPADLNGFPMILNPDGTIDTLKCGFVPIEHWPIHCDEPPINPETGERYAGWIILLDEFNSAAKEVQAASYKLILDRMVGMHKLHSRCLIMAAGNKMGDKAIVNRVGTAQQTRMVWFNIRCSNKVWLKWADRENLDHRVRSFIRFKHDLLHKFDPNHTDHTFPCPRTWHFISKLIKPYPEIVHAKLPLLTGTVGDGAGREFYSYAQIYSEIVTIPEIIADPTGCHLGSSPSMHFALAGLISQKMTDANAAPLVEFLARIGADFQVVALRNAITRDPMLKRTKALQGWIAKNTDELVDSRAKMVT